MKTARCLLFVIAVMLCADPLAARAADSSGSSLGSWFGRGSQSAKPAKTKKVSNTSSTSAIKKMTDAPKRFVSSTKSMLTPKSPAPAKNNNMTSVQSKNAKDAQPGFFKSLFNPEPPPPPQTIKDWMKLKQIHP